MLSEALAALAAAGGTAVVQVASTDAWAEFRNRVARLIARGSRERELVELQRLDRTAALLTAECDEAAEIGQVAAWQAHFEALLDRLQGAERDSAIAELRALVEGSTARNRDGGGNLTGNVFHGPTAVQTGSDSRQDNHFGHSA
ncbi:hypothetical protein OG905_35555 [Streptomyces sp. NBC_00322]|uniref:hypothetical protein n=1 Tax=Streptomyces sp. NBC_00322 TaxID=2975712 RepID=UPI002E28EF7B|nr:hypothetical protein [Streptomyces sp. NBC_00322]